MVDTQISFILRMQSLAKLRSFLPLPFHGHCGTASCDASPVRSLIGAKCNDP